MKKILVAAVAEGDLGAVRVEARGAAADGSRVTVIAGAVSTTARLAGAVATVTALQVLPLAAAV